MKNYLQQILVFFLITLSLACSGGGLTSEQKNSANDALKTLRKIEAATQVGVNYQQFGQLAIDAQAAVNQAVANLPDGEVKSEIVAAMEGYADSANAWGASINDKLATDSKLKSDLQQKYEFDYDKISSTVSKDDLRTLLLSTIWDASKNRLNKATSLLDKTNADWKFPAKGISSKESNGFVIYELGDEFRANHTQSPKKGHMISVSVPASVNEKAKQTTTDEKEIGKIIAWEAFNKVGYPAGDLNSSFINSFGKTVPIYKLRMASGETAYALTLIGNNQFIKGSIVTISKNPLGNEDNPN